MTAIRTFVAIPLPEDLKHSLSTTCAALRNAPGGRAARWVSVENMHLTLKFIGDVQTSHMEELRKAVATVCTRVAPLRVVIARLGCFPSNASPRVIWAGIAEGAPDLRSLARQIDDALGALGYPRDTRPFSAHITVARADKRAIAAELTALGRSVGSWPEATFGELVVQSVSVVQSDLHPSGPIYTNICTVPLQGLPGSLDAPHTAY